MTGFRWQLRALAASCCLVGCQPNVVIGQFTCPAGTSDAGAAPEIAAPISIPWSTGFENRFCDFALPTGFCTEPVQYTIVTSPAKSGHYAAAFNVVAVDGGTSQQSRCGRQGTLPPSAYYGAWYFLPASATNSNLWNLFHFQGADTPTAVPHGLWDVSLMNGVDGTLHARVLDFLWTGAPNGNVADSPVPVPIGTWFHLEFFLKRAKDGTGEAALYQDGVRVVHYANVRTDNTNWGQWFVGNLADSLNPPDSTVYVDDVTIAATLGYTPPH